MRDVNRTQSGAFACIFGYNANQLAEILICLNQIALLLNLKISSLQACYWKNQAAPDLKRLSLENNL
jgi:hypothetical protein